MASFCSGCGFPLAESVTFCSHCGARNSGAPSQSYQQPPASQPVAQAATPQSYQQPPANTASAAPVAAAGGSGMKILAIVLVVIFAIGAAAIVGVMYAVHRVKTAVVETAKNYGVELPTDSTPAASPSRAARAKPACDYLSKDDAQNLLGEPIDHTLSQDGGCLYFGPPGLSAKLAKERADEMIKRAQEPGAKVDANDLTGVIAGITTGMADANGNVGGDGPLLILVIALEDGKVQMTAMTATKALFNPIGKGDDGKGPGFGADIPGLGDRAVRLPKLGLNVLKGNALIRIMPGPIPDSDRRTIDIARVLLPKI